MSNSTSAAAPAIPPDIATLTGPLLIGLCGNWGLFGCSSVQVYLYYLGFPKDNWKLKTLVYGLYIWDAAQTFLLTISVFSPLASGWGSVTALETIGFDWFDLPLMSGVASAIVQCFYAWRIYVLGKSLILTIFIVLLALLEGTAAVAFAIIIPIRVQSFADLQVKTEAVTSVWLLGSAVCDVVISTSMIYLLTRARKRTGYRDTGSTLTRLIRLTVGGGLLTTSVAILDGVLYLTFPNNNFHLAPVCVLAKVYFNALMVLFNSRRRQIPLNGSNADSVTYTWDGEHGHSQPSHGSSNLRSRTALNSALTSLTTGTNRNFGQISVDVNVDRRVDQTPSETFQMSTFTRQESNDEQVKKLDWEGEV